MGALALDKYAVGTLDSGLGPEAEKCDMPSQIRTAKNKSRSELPFALPQERRDHARTQVHIFKGVVGTKFLIRKN